MFRDRSFNGFQSSLPSINWTIKFATSRIARTIMEIKFQLKRSSNFGIYNKFSPFALYACSMKVFQLAALGAHSVRYVFTTGWNEICKGKSLIFSSQPPFYPRWKGRRTLDGFFHFSISKSMDLSLRGCVCELSRVGKR